MFNDYKQLVADQAGQFFSAVFGGGPGNRYILDINEYLGHYTEGWTETVMFFIPSPA